MKAQGIFLGILLCLFVGCGPAKDSPNKSITDQTANNGKKVADLMESYTFEFIATRAFPLSGTPKNLAGDSYSVTFSPKMINSTLPFYGRAYTGVGITGDNGMQFKGKPEDFTICQNDGYQLNTTVKDGDTYQISLSISNSGSARLTISSNDRETISYQGKVVAISE